MRAQVMLVFRLLYKGGFAPSLLSPASIQTKILSAIKHHYNRKVLPCQYPSAFYDLFAEGILFHKLLFEVIIFLT